MTSQNDDASSDDNEITAHLDRGWDHLAHGDLDKAGLSARQLLEIDPESPEAFTLQGAIAAARGEPGEALEHYQRAMDLDPEYVDPLLYAAEVHLGPDGDLDEALRLCDLALDVAEEEDAFIDALLLKAEAQFEAGDEDGARETVRELPPADLPEVEHHLRAARVYIDLRDLDDAERHLQAALARDAASTDALHLMGLVYEERGDARRMAQAFLEVREADLLAPPPPWGVTAQRFEELAEAALEELPAQIRKLIGNVPVMVADYPSVELVAEGSDPRMMGFFSGTPLPEKSSLGGDGPHLDCIFLYQRNIERYARTTAEVEEEIRRTVLHETGHFFGLSEEDLEEMGLG